MSRIARAIEILEAINNHFREGADCVYRDGLILSDNSTLADAIAECIGEAENQIAPVPIIPRSQRRKVVHYRGVISGWIGKRKVQIFGTDQVAAYKWLHEEA